MQSTEPRDTTSGYVGGFSQVDAAGPPQTYLSLLDNLSRRSMVQAYKRRTFELLDLRPGYRVLDVGCGTGDDVRAMADIVGTTGQAIGLDSSEAMLAVARTRAAGMTVVFRAGDAACLPFADDSFDACRADRVLHHLDDPAAVLREMVRVTRSGGRVVVAEPDFDTMIVDHPDFALTRLLYSYLAGAVRQPFVGRQLFALADQCGLSDVAAEPFGLIWTDLESARQQLWVEATLARAQESGEVSAVAAAGWLAELEAADSHGRFFGAVTGFIVSGRK